MHGLICEPNARAADCFGPVHVLLFGDFKSTYLNYTIFFVYSQENISQLKKKSDINRIIFGEENKNDNIIEFEKDYEVPDLATILTPDENKKTDNEWLNEIIDDI